MYISVIIPTYEPKNYIFDCLEALKNQTLNKDYFEVLIILNGEKNPFYNEILLFLEKENLKNFKLYYTDIKGVSNARNIGLDKAKGQYIAFVDDDDYVDNNYLETMYNTIKDIDKGICCANYKNFEEKSLKEINVTTYRWGHSTSNIIKYRKIFSSIGAKLIPAIIIDDVRFNTQLKNSEDALFMTLISKNIKEIYIAKYKTYYNRRVRYTSANTRKKSLSEILYVFRKLMKYHIGLLGDRQYDKKFIFVRFLAIIKGSICQIKNSLFRN